MPVCALHILAPGAAPMSQAAEQQSTPLASAIVNGSVSCTLRLLQEERLDTSMTYSLPPLQPGRPTGPPPLPPGRSPGREAMDPWLAGLIMSCIPPADPEEDYPL